MVRTLMPGLMLVAAAHVAAAADATTAALAADATTPARTAAATMPAPAPAAGDTTNPTPAVASDTATPAPAATSATAAPAPASANDMVTAPLVAAASVPATVSADAAPKEGSKKPTDSTRAGDGKSAGPAAVASQPVQPGGDVKMSGMSILGNEDAPKSLVIVPWKSSQLAAMPSVSRLLDSATQPVDKDVFMRELAYYEFKSGSK